MLAAVTTDARHAGLVPKLKHPGAEFPRLLAVQAGPDLREPVLFLFLDVVRQMSMYKPVGIAEWRMSACRYLAASSVERPALPPPFP